MEPVVFNGCFGWLHPPAPEAATARGVVLCPPFGHDAVCTGRGSRVLAEMLAAAGMPVLRFDYPGTGDSDGDEAPGSLEAWIGSVRAAADRLRAHPGVAEVALCGFRLGADLAAAAAARRPGEVAALALLAPVGSGRAWRRQLLLGAAGGEAKDGAEWLEAAGFRVHRGDLEAARSLDLGAALLAAEVPRVLVTSAASVLGTEVAARLRSAGAALEQRPFEGWQAFLRDAHLSVLPRAALAEAVAWLRTGAPPATAGSAVPDPPPADATPLLSGGARESAVRFGPGNALVGVLCEPLPGRCAAAAAPGPAVLLTNTGANGRIGNGRMAVRLARRLAAAGVSSLRIDASGIGDSADLGADGPPDTYHPRLVEDVVAALDLLESRGHPACVVAGLCSGAHAAFQAAVRDARVRGLVLANLPAFDRGAGGAPALDGGPPPGERPAFRRPRMLARRLAAEADRLAAERLGLELGLDRGGRWMRAVLARGAEVVLAYSAGDRGLRELRAHFGRFGRRLPASGAARCVVLNGSDHSLLPRAMQDEFAALVEAQALRSRLARDTAAPRAAAAKIGGSRFGEAPRAALARLFRRWPPFPGASSPGVNPTARRADA